MVPAQPFRPQGTQGTLWCQHSPPGPKGSRVHYGASTMLQAPRKAGYTMVPAQGSRPQGKQGTLWCQQKAPGIVRAFGRAWNSQKRAVPGMRAGPLGAHVRRGSRNARREAGAAQERGAPGMRAGGLRAHQERGPLECRQRGWGLSVVVGQNPPKFISSLIRRPFQSSGGSLVFLLDCTLAPWLISWASPRLLLGLFPGLLLGFSLAYFLGFS